MTHGKNICNQLKEVRKRIAEENSIPLEIEECTYKGECRGTCPRCEAEVRFLENALADRLRLGKVATVAGLALGLAATTMQAQTVEPVAEPSVVRKEVRLADAITLKGKIVDGENGEGVPFCSIRIKCQGETVLDTLLDNDFRGTFSLLLPKGVVGKDCDILIAHFGYEDYIAQFLPARDYNFGSIKLRQIPPRYILGGVEPIPISNTPRGHVEYFQEPFGTSIIVR